MILKPITYRTGIIWIDEEGDLTPNSIAYDTLAKQLVYASGLKTLTHQEYRGLVLVVAETDVPVPELPSIELKEDVEELAKQRYKYQDGPDHSYDAVMNNRRIGFIDGYKANEKKYTEDDIKQAMLDYGDYIFNQHKGTFSSGDLERAKERILQSLQPRIKHVEIETEYKEIPCPDGIEDCEVFHAEIIPVTYVKNKCLYLKLKEIVYGKSNTTP